MLKYNLRLVAEEVVGYECVTATDSKVVTEFLIEKLRVHEEPEEIVLVLFVGSSGKINGYSEVARGSISSCPFSNREIIKRALVANCGRIIVVHNHPNRTEAFSNDDVRATLRLQDACNLLQINLIDHFLVAGEKVISAVEGGIL